MCDPCFKHEAPKAIHAHSYTQIPAELKDNTIRPLDKNVAQVQRMLETRMERGYTKYGVTTERTDLTLREWLLHLQEELLDAAVYVERIKGSL